MLELRLICALSRFETNVGPVLVHCRYTVWRFCAFRAQDHNMSRALHLIGGLSGAWRSVPSRSVATEPDAARVPVREDEAEHTCTVHSS
jgi:hypothetical protein